MDGSFLDQQDSVTAQLYQNGLTPAFKVEVDRFLDTALTPDLVAAGQVTTGLKSGKAACKLWHKRLYERGWIAPCWPSAFGGADWTAAQRLYFENECAARDAPVLMSSGIRTIGPLIIEMGHAQQQADYLPKILNGEHQWCQGFSEPHAGSDLTALSLCARQEGDVFILNGSKIWTSFAADATHMFMLARVDPQSRRGAGLVFLLIDLAMPGITIRPIPFIDGEADTNEVFFDNVCVPVADRIGAIGEGWAAAKRLMSIARSNNTTTGVLRRAFRLALRQAEQVPDMALKFASIRARIASFEAMEARVQRRQATDPMPASSSVLKLQATELHQAITELGLEAAPHDPLSISKYFATRAATIYSGTSEIHRNIIAKAIGCP